MSSWSEGYVSDINYTFGYYEDLNPNNAIIPLLMAGFAVPEVLNACELGFGQGISLNVHANAGSAKWYATDFNPSQASFAQHLSQISNNQAFVVDQSFAEFCQRDDLPEFDFIGLHGIWSWISDENRAIITDFIRRKLKVGGILYISYNTLPGWSAASPLRHLLLAHHSSMTSALNDRQQNIKESIDFVEKVFDQSQKLLQDSPNLSARIKSIKNQDLHYIAHEYLNQDWKPMYFADMQKWLEPAKLTFACPTNYLHSFNDCLYNAEQLQLIKSINEPNFAQTVKDFILGTQFRKDIWIKGGRKLNNYEKLQAWRKLDVILTTSRKMIEMSATNYLKINLNADLFTPVLDILQDHQIHNVGKLMDKLKGQLPEEGICSALAVLAGKSDLAVAQPMQAIEQARPRCKAYNHYLLSQARSAEFNVQYFASPITGSAIFISLLDRWFLLAQREGLKEKEWIQFVADLLKENNLNLNDKDGQTIQDDALIRSRIEELKQNFIENSLPSLKYLEII